jgi:hypothetical protein
MISSEVLYVSVNSPVSILALTRRSRNQGALCLVSSIYLREGEENGLFGSLLEDMTSKPLPELLNGSLQITS